MGDKSDGGYALPAKAIHGIKSCISIGLGGNWSFEKSLKDEFGIQRIIIYDGTVGLCAFVLDAIAAFRDFILRRRSFNHLYKRILFCFQYFKFFRRRIVHEKKMIVETSASKKQLSIGDVLNRIRQPEETILKIDIEGNEYGLARQLLTAAKFRRIRILIMEWHETERCRSEFLQFVHEMSVSHYLVHLHENNCTPLAADLLPITLQLVWQSKKIEVLDERVEKLPIIGIDCPNNHKNPAHNFKFF